MSSYQNFTELLKAEFEKRKERNPSYSRRAYAKFLDTNIGVISGLFSGKRKLSPKYIESFGLKLSLNLEEIQDYQRDHKLKHAIKEDEEFQKYTQISLDSYRMVADWYHISLLYLQKKNGMLPSIDEISDRLEVKKTDIKNALMRLERLNVIKRVPTGFKVISNAFYSNIDSTYTLEAGKNFIKDTLLKSVDALEHIDRDLRDHSTITMSFPEKDMPAAKEMIKKFRRKFLSNFDKSSDKNDVYSLSVSFFPLSKKNR
jgi:uncharacterized protein (TIGR02147 family)